MQHRPWRKTGYQITTLIAVALLLLILFVSAGYFFALDQPALNPGREPLEAAFARNLDLWNSRRPVAFDYVVERDCVCAADYRRPYLARENRQSRAAAYTSPLADVDDTASTAPPEPVWLDGLFELIADAIRNAAAVTVAYDPAFGFPTRVDVDWSGQTADDDQRFRVRDFRVIEYRE
jgi:hypothetical protein